MKNERFSLTKTKIKSGLQCHKKLWYDLNDPIKEKNFIFSIGNRFGEHIKSHYGEGLDLTGQFGSDVESLTRNAMLDPNVKVIYEAAFIFSQTQVRVDVLIRNGKKWELIEIKSSISLKDEHIKDAAIQVYVITNSNVLLSDVRIAHINKNFCYAGNDEYSNLILEIDINENVKRFLPSVQGWINDLLPITDKNLGVPIKEMGDQCSKPHRCPYIKRCESQTYLADVEIPISILPNVGSSLQKEWFKKNIYDLRDLPVEVLKKDSHRKIQLCHKKSIELISPELRGQIKRYEWPRYFIDFETVMQGVPLIKNTKPYEAFPFQFSVHKWESENQVLTLADSYSFLEFCEEGMDKRFLLSLIEILGESGPIFTHNRSTEVNAMLRLVDREHCVYLKSAVERIIFRTIDTLSLMRDGFYNPKMMGSFSLKDIVKVLPNAFKYSNEGEAVGDGGSAMIKWFECTNPNIDKDKKNRTIEELKKYCAQDTLNLYHLFKYISCN
jgi:hypothetical protein